MEGCHRKELLQREPREPPNRKGARTTTRKDVAYGCCGEEVILKLHACDRASFSEPKS